MLGMQMPRDFRDSPQQDVWAVFKGWFAKKEDQARQGLGSTPLPADFNVDTYLWADDGGHNAMHYLAIGRQRTNYAKWKTNYPLFGEFGFKTGRPAAETSKGRAKILEMLLATGKLDISAASCQNNAHATPLHFLAISNNETMLKVVGPFLTGEALCITDELSEGPRRGAEGEAGVRPVDLALKAGHLRLVIGLGLAHCRGLADVEKELDEMMGLGGLAGNVLGTAAAAQAGVEGVEDAGAEVSSRILSNDEVSGNY